MAGFIGSPKMNVLSARVADPQARTLALAGDSAARASLPWLRSPLAEGQEVLLGIRPQHLRLAEDGVLRLQPDMVEQLAT